MKYKKKPILRENTDGTATVKVFIREGHIEITTFENLLEALAFYKKECKDLN